MLISIVGVIFALGILIFFHEFGHFLSAKISKVKVEKFSFGMGPELIGKTIKETRYAICSFPIGGSVKLSGELIDEVKGLPYEFFSKPWYTRIGICVAGPIMSYFLAFLIFAFLLIYSGIPSDEPVIGEVIDGMPAEVAGLRPYDKIIFIDDKPVRSWLNMAEIIHNSEGKELKIKFLRNNISFEKTIRPVYNEKTKKYLIGISPLIEKPPIFAAITYPLKQLFITSYLTIAYLISKLTKLEKVEVAGPVGVIHFIAKSTHEGFYNFIYIIGFLSSMIGLFNLLPIPLLDGGHIFLYLIEGVSGRKLSKKFITFANAVGLSILAWIVIYATYSDILRIIKP